MLFLCNWKTPCHVGYFQLNFLNNKKKTQTKREREQKNTSKQIEIQKITAQNEAGKTGSGRENNLGEIAAFLFVFSFNTKIGKKTEWEKLREKQTNPPTPALQCHIYEILPLILTHCPTAKSCFIWLPFVVSSGYHLFIKWL